MRFCRLWFLALPLFLGLAGCSTNSGKYFQNDGPPSGWSNYRMSTKDAVPKVEKPVAAANRPYKVMGKRYVPQTGDKTLVQTGYASWYGKQFHGKKTSIGERYNMYEMTAAHTTMELPSYARVTNLENGRSVIVRVNDRGPFLHSRVIDLSYAAAHKLGYVNKGTARVRVERITRKQIASGSWKGSGSWFSTASAEKASPAPVVKSAVTAAAATVTTAAVTQSAAVNSVSAAAEVLKTAEPDPMEAIISAQSITIEPAATFEPDQAPSAEAVSAGKKFIEEGVFVMADGSSSVEEARVEMVPIQTAGNRYAIQLGVFKDKINADKLVAKVRAEIDPQLSSTTRVEATGNSYKVLIGSGYLPDQARSLADEIKERTGISAFIVKE